MPVAQKETKRQEIVRFIENSILPVNPLWVCVAVRSQSRYERHNLNPELQLDCDCLRGVHDDGTPFEAAWEDIMALEYPKQPPISR